MAHGQSTVDVHRDFCEVAISEGGPARLAGRVATRRDRLELFAVSLAPTRSGGAGGHGQSRSAIARILAPHVAEVVLAHPKRLRVISHAKIRPTGSTPGCWPSAGRRAGPCGGCLTSARVRCGADRPASRVVKRRTQVKNEAQRCCIATSSSVPSSATVRTKGRARLQTVRVADDEQLTLDGALRQLDFLDGELARLDGEIARRVVDDADVPADDDLGVNVTTAATLKAAMGRRRFPTPRHLVGYLGLHLTVRQSGSGQARHGRTSKEGSAAARHVLVEAAWSAAGTGRCARSRSA